MTHEEIHKTCKKYNIEDYYINDDKSVNVYGDVDLDSNNLKELPLNFNIVGGYFNCSNNNLITLIGSPKKVEGYFTCYNNYLITLMGSPIEVGGIFDCSNNNLRTLKGSPKKVGDNFYCKYNKLESLYYAPLEVGGYFRSNNNLIELNYDSYVKKVKRIIKLKNLNIDHKGVHKICKKYHIKNYNINDDGSVDVDGDVRLYHVGLDKLPLIFNKVSGDFDCSSNKLESLEGSPKEVGGNFWCEHNKLVTLEGSPLKVVKDFACSFNELTSLKYSPLEIGGSFYGWDNKVKLDFEGHLKKSNRMNKLKQLI